MIIELLKCQGCWRVIDQFTIGFGCESCFTKFFKPIGPSKFNIFRWFLSNPKHVIRLYLEAFKEKING